MESNNKFVMLVVGAVVSIVLITSLLVPVIADFGSNSDSGSTVDALYYKAPVEDEEHTYSLFNEYNDDYLSGKLTVLLDDTVMKEVDWDSSSIDESNRPDNVIIPILYGGTIAEMQGVEIDVDYMIFASISYYWSGQWSPITSVVNTGTATMMGNTNIIYDENNITELPFTINVVGDTVVEVDGQSPVIPFNGIELMLSEEGTHFYIENPKFSADDDIAIVDYYIDAIWISQADWNTWSVTCWFTGKIADIDEMNYKETMITSADVISLSAVANMSNDELDSIDVDVIFEDDHKTEFQITHAIVPAYEDNGGGSGGGSVKTILNVIPLLMIVGVIMFVIGGVIVRRM